MEKQMTELKLWWLRNFKVISIQRAKEIGLKPYRNIYGDEINHLNCRSLWIDSKGKCYKVDNLVNILSD